MAVMKRRQVRISVRWMMMAVAVVAVVSRFILLPMHRAAQEAACKTNLRTIGLALHQYHAVYGCFPPAYTTDANGTPMHSWRVLILPFAGEDALYRAYRFDEPWNGPNNVRIVRRMPAFYACPNHAQPGYSSYAVVVGPETAFPGTGSCSLSQLLDGPNMTIAVVEVEEGMIPWTDPRDPTLAPPATSDTFASVEFSRKVEGDLRRQGFADRDRHSKGPNFLFCDGRVDEFRGISGALCGQC